MEEALREMVLVTCPACKERWRSKLFQEFSTNIPSEFQEILEQSSKGTDARSLAVKKTSFVALEKGKPRTMADQVGEIQQQYTVIKLWREYYHKNTTNDLLQFDDITPATPAVFTQQEESEDLLHFDDDIMTSTPAFPKRDESEDLLHFGDGMNTTPAFPKREETERFDDAAFELLGPFDTGSTLNVERVMDEWEIHGERLDFAIPKNKKSSHQPPTDLLAR